MRFFIFILLVLILIFQIILSFKVKDLDSREILTVKTGVSYEGFYYWGLVDSKLQRQGLWHFFRKNPRSSITGFYHDDKRVGIWNYLYNNDVYEKYYYLNDSLYLFEEIYPELDIIQRKYVNGIKQDPFMMFLYLEDGEASCDTVLEGGVGTSIQDPVPFVFYE